MKGEPAFVALDAVQHERGWAAATLQEVHLRTADRDSFS